MACCQIDISRGAGHGIQMQQHFKMSERASRCHTAFAEFCRQARQIGYKSSCSLGALFVCTSQKEDLSALVGIFNEGNDGIRIAGGPTGSSWYILRPFTWARMEVADKF